MRCPICRAEVPDVQALRPNVLLSSLIEKFFPDSAAVRRAELVEEQAVERARHMVSRQISIKVLREGNEASVMLQMVGASRCPMHQGARVPVEFYVARACATFPGSWSPRTSTYPATETQQPGALQQHWILRSCCYPLGTEGEEEDNVEVVVYFQPRFQITPQTAQMKLCAGAEITRSVEFDSRLIHPVIHR